MEVFETEHDAMIDIQKRLEPLTLEWEEAKRAAIRRCTLNGGYDKPLLKQLELYLRKHPVRSGATTPEHVSLVMAKRDEILAIKISLEKPKKNKVVIPKMKGTSEPVDKNLHHDSDEDTEPPLVVATAVLIQDEVRII